MRPTFSARAMAMMSAILALPTKPVSMLTRRAWAGGEGWARAKPRPAKHQRTGVFTQSERRKARRRHQLTTGHAQSQRGIS